MFDESVCDRNRGLEDLRQEIPGVSRPTTQKENCVLVTDNSVCQ